MSVTADLPALTLAESEHSDRLIRCIREKIDAEGGWISFARFMEMALYEPGLGYYSAGAAKFGAAGDFVTAPEISALFGRCVARQCAEVLGRLGGGDVLEMGAGSGVMAADVLNELEALNASPGVYRILEVSADLRERQLATLAARAARHVKKVEWLERWPAKFSGVVLANEVLDALPVERFRIRGEEISALGVTWQLGRLDWSEARAGRELTRAVRALEKSIGQRLPDGYTSELNLALPAWLAGLAAALSAGVILFMDYGLPRKQYYRDERGDGTLLCHFRHRYHADPFSNVGLQDIGAWVDFTAVAEAATKARLDVTGFATQAQFLISLGIDRYLSEAGQRELTERVALARQVMMLTLPGEMGERFKVMALSRRVAGPLSGFSLRDLAASL